ncbi:staphylopine uptake ABC transporter ATP-binding protein CntD [Paenibacillus alba]|uniref:ABC transporter ATP-binding protein n=1 Tax=Paenibacillus alba TaxID=1197127 RepID=A0ABU6FUX0_9BACL|nr:ABC transporter ATP-binding protein [Paenibacillus alba]MEC0225678.1 ABC transporter ATP-binding protein [Paenibacillus alba]
MNVLKVEHLNVWDANTNELIVADCSFQLKQGSCLSIVGESGSGKSMTCRAIMRLNKPWIRQSGAIHLNGENIMKLSAKEMRKRRGKQLCMIVQNGMRAFDPSCVIGVHMRETLAQHFGWNRKESEEHIIRAMASVMLKDPAENLNKYPHELSGGMLQRMMIALSLVLEPEVVIADEPTSALDAISQFEVVEQLIHMRERTGCSMIVISHDFAVVKKVADEVLVMKDGAIIERGRTQAIFTEAQHPYTQYLISSRLALSAHFKKLVKEERVEIASR